MSLLPLKAASRRLRGAGLSGNLIFLFCLLCGDGERLDMGRGRLGGDLRGGERLGGDRRDWLLLEGGGE